LILLTEQQTGKQVRQRAIHYWEQLQCFPVPRARHTLLQENLQNWPAKRSNHTTNFLHGMRTCGDISTKLINWIRFVCFHYC